jgi:hypothetical protein
MALPTPTAGAQAWSDGVTNGVTKYKDRVQATTADQAQLAVNQQAVLKSNFNAAVDSGKWAARVLARGTSYWKSQTVAKSDNWGNSATTGKANYERAAAQLYPFEQQLQQQVQGMAKGTRAASLARFTAWMDGMIAFGDSYTR